MKLGYVILYVPDVAGAVDFYRRAFSLQLKFMHESAQYAEMLTGDTSLAFAHTGLLEAGAGLDPAAGMGSCFEIGLVTEDVPAAMARARDAGAVMVKEPVVKPWGQTVAWVQDPFGTLVELCTPLS